MVCIGHARKHGTKLVTCFKSRNRNPDSTYPTRRRASVFQSQRNSNLPSVAGGIKKHESATNIGICDFKQNLPYTYGCYLDREPRTVLCRMPGISSDCLLRFFTAFPQGFSEQLSAVFSNTFREFSENVLSSFWKQFTGNFRNSSLKSSLLFFRHFLGRFSAENQTFTRTVFSTVLCELSHFFTGFCGKKLASGSLQENSLQISALRQKTDLCF